MAKVTAEDLPWLSKPSTGHRLFAKPPVNPPPPPPPQDVDVDTEISPTRLVATRGSEIFVGRGNEVRCADLQELKARHPKLGAAAAAAAEVAVATVGHHPHKTLQLPELDWEVRQLEVSPDGLYLAIAGVTELAVCVLPGEGFLKREGRTALMVPHYHRVGTSVHNIDAGTTIVRTLWHPLGVEGASLLVLTTDGVLRTYDFMIGCEPSFELAEQTLDLVAMRGCGKRRGAGGYMADGDSLVPASCCFADGEAGWRPFTLYILMRGGDVYGLSPLVPSRWLTTREHIQGLSLDITADLEDLADGSVELKTSVRQQMKWINDVLNQDHAMAAAYNSLASPRSTPTCYRRPETVGPAPALQGPFLFRPAPEEFDVDDCYAACDIFHVELEPTGILGIMYSHGKLDICIEPDQLPAKWEDKKRRPSSSSSSNNNNNNNNKNGNGNGNGNGSSSSSSSATATLPVVSGFQTIDLGIHPPDERDSENNSWPVFARDVHTSQILFVQHPAGVTAFSMKTWIPKFRAVLDDDESDGFLDAVLGKCPPTAVQQVIQRKAGVDSVAVLYEAYVGYILLAGHRHGVASVEFDEPIDPTPSPITAAAAAATGDDTFILQASTPRPRVSSSSFSSSQHSTFITTTPQPQPIHFRGHHKKHSSLSTTIMMASPKGSISINNNNNNNSSSNSNGGNNNNNNNNIVSVLQPPYDPSPSFSTPSLLPNLTLAATNHYGSSLVSKPILFSTTSSQLLRSARVQLKQEYDQLMAGAQAMHDRAASQRLEYAKQLRTLHAVDQRLAELQQKQIGPRLERFCQCQEELRTRADELLKQLILRGERGLSDAERRWGAEVGKVRDRVEARSGAAGGGGGGGKHGIEQRVEAVRCLVENLKVAAAAGGNGGGGAGTGAGADGGVPEEVRRRRVQGLFEMLERESILVKATRQKLEGLELEVERPS